MKFSAYHIQLSPKKSGRTISAASPHEIEISTETAAVRKPTRNASLLKSARSKTLCNSSSETLCGRPCSAKIFSLLYCPTLKVYSSSFR